MPPLELPEDPRQIGKLIRNLRREQDLTGVAIAKQAGISQSKLSKIETGIILPTAAEAQMMLHILGVAEHIQQQIADLLSRRRTERHTPDRQPQTNHDDALDFEASASTVSILTINAIPSLLQTATYMASKLRHYQAGTADFEHQKAVWLQRQDLMLNKRRRSNFIIIEAALYTPIVGPHDMLIQLDRLERMTNFANIEIGILPTAEGLTQLEHGAFAYYELPSRTVVHQPYVGGAYISSEPDVVAACRHAFETLRKRAAYHDSARILIRQAADGLRA